MIIYNVTVSVEQSIAEQWLQWVFDEHISDIMSTGCFVDYRVVRLLDVDESEGPTYAIQFTAESKADYNRYTAMHAPGLRQRSFDRWGNGFMAFRSVMQVVEKEQRG